MSQLRLKYQRKTHETSLELIERILVGNSKEAFALGQLGNGCRFADSGRSPFDKVCEDLGSRLSVSQWFRALAEQAANGARNSGVVDFIGDDFRNDPRIYDDRWHANSGYRKVES